MHSLYLIVNVSSVIVPFIFSFHPKIKFYKHFQSVWLALFFPAIVFLLWDSMFTAMGIWGFNPRYLIGISIFNLPLEEVLFFICIPYACLFTYFCLNTFYKLHWSAKSSQTASILIAAVLFIIGLLNYDKAYTLSTFLSTALILLILTFALKITWLGKLLSIYPILLIPFFIVNGILTGSGLEEPIVWYNDSENLGIRLFTIPIEDVVYGFEMILLNVFVFERLKSVTPNPSSSIIK